MVRLGLESRWDSDYGLADIERAFIVIPERALAVLLMHKNASSSINAAAATLGILPQSYPVEMIAARIPHRVAMIRSPHERIESAWSMFRDSKHIGVMKTDFASWVVEVCACEAGFGSTSCPKSLSWRGFRPPNLCAGTSLAWAS